MVDWRWLGILRTAIRQTEPTIAAADRIFGDSARNAGRDYRHAVFRHSSKAAPLPNGATTYGGQH